MHQEQRHKSTGKSRKVSRFRFQVSGFRFQVKAWCSLKSMAPVSWRIVSIVSYSVLLIYSNFMLSSRRYSVSASEPIAIFKNCLNSFLFLLADPSTILVGTEIAALLIWDVSPYNSSLGNCFVTI